MAHLQLGDLGVTGLSDLERFSIPLTTLFPAAEPARLEGCGFIGAKSLSDGLLHLAVRSWLLRLDGRVILIDACIGDHKERPHMPAWHRRDGRALLRALAAEGLAPEDVDIVMCTHLHADHVGWNTEVRDGRWVPTFANARYLCGRTEYRFWEGQAGGPADRHGSFADSVLPVMEAGQMDLVDDGWQMARGLTLAPVPGHTPGQMCVAAAHGDGAVFPGDAIHSLVQLAAPDWSSAFCIDPGRARATRAALLDSLADTPRWLIPAHFPNPGWVRVVRDGAGYRPA